MGFEFEDLPHWEFTVLERSPGIYNVTAIRDGGIRGESTGADSEGMIEDLKNWGEKDRNRPRGETRQVAPNCRSALVVLNSTSRWHWQRRASTMARARHHLQQ